MKKILFIILATSILFISCKNTSTKKQVENVANLKTDRIEVLDFYGKHRCKSCVDIERNTKTTLNQHFSEELKNKKIIFKLIQWDNPENDALVNKFEAAGTSLIIYRIKNGKEYINDITDFAFKQSEHDTIFVNTLKKMLTNELKKQ